MVFPENFICATKEYSTLDEHTPSPYFRREFIADNATDARVLIGVCGFYELYLNGKKYTKGALAPYISNPDDIVYYDEYTLPLKKGENVIGVQLGNGFQNNPGGYIWDFDKTDFRSAPKFALSVEWTNADGEEVRIETDEEFLTHPSPITFDDYRFGEHYNANLELKNWNDTGFDASDWKKPLAAPCPKGEKRICAADPIVVTREIKPVSISRYDEKSYLYDFGENCAGVCRLKICGRKGQKIEFVHVERLREGKISYIGLWFDRDEKQYAHDLEIIHKDIYTCKGDGEEVYVPAFVYHGFRYVLISGIDDCQATEDTLTYLVMNSDLKERGGFSCSDPTANKLQEMTRRSDLANFYYFPTDCPHREKNGWTGDAALSAEHMILNLTVEKSYREWQNNLIKAQTDFGRIPGVVPTGGWGVSWNVGPAWDCALTYLPYFTYVYRGETDMITPSADAIVKNMQYWESLLNEDGLLDAGLGDWCPVGKDAGDYAAPLKLTSTIMAMDIAKKAAVMFEKVGLTQKQNYAVSQAEKLRKAVRDHLIDFSTMTVTGECQTSQAMALFYGIFEEDEKERAFDRLLEFINAKKNHFDVGVLGGRVIFHVLAEFGHADLAYEMITTPEYPSYGNWIEQGATSLWEQFDETDRVSSMNHHFWGDISGWFIKCIAGIRFNPNGNNINEVDIRPEFIGKLDFAEGFYDAPGGRISVKWRREGRNVILDVSVPENMSGTIRLSDTQIVPLKNGTYRIYA